MSHAEACARLSPRQRETLILLGTGFNSKTAAEQIGLSQHTVKRHAKSILEKLGVPTMTQAAVIAAKANLL